MLYVPQCRMYNTVYHMCVVHNLDSAHRVYKVTAYTVYAVYARIQMSATTMYHTLRAVYMVCTPYTLHTEST